MIKRDVSIDVLRSIGLLCIILAHVSAPKFVLQIRNFDVPLMAFIMGISFYLTNKNKHFNLIEYSKKRFKRLLFPTWKFLTIFFTFFYFFSLFKSTAFPFTKYQILTSFIPVGGIGYVWIIFVYLGIAVLNPFILFISEKIQSNLKYFILLFCIWVIYLFVLFPVLVILPDPFDEIFKIVVMQTVAYGLISAIGIRIKLVSNKKIFVSSFLFIFIYFIYALTLNFEYSYLYKYPPQNYYLAYALGVSFLLYSIFNKFSFRLNNMNNMNNLFIWISKNSFDIYLWHILALYLLKELEFNNQIFYNWFIQYIIILLFSFFMVVLSKKISIIKLS